MNATHVGSAWSCTVRLVVGDSRALAPAAEDLTALLSRIDGVASRFRPYSALSIANARAGRPTPVPRILVDLVSAALDAAALTDGAVDPTLGLAMHRNGYDRDFAHIPVRHHSPAPAPLPASLLSATPVGRWPEVRLHREAGLLTVPAGTALDLGATAKAYVADHAALALSQRYQTPVLVELGGDLAVAGHWRGPGDDRRVRVGPDGGWPIRVAEVEGGAGQVVTLRHGGLVTSTTTVRRWTHRGQAMHHILDPRTGEPTTGPWRTATVSAPSALAANVASTAAIVMGAGAVKWLEARGLAARLVSRDGLVRTVGDWPPMSSTSVPSTSVPSTAVPSTAVA
ncbi:MAG: FAD:protein FMN transferase [Actinomycetota bacterium]|nr:FAD:protein FMN transferase [Actinomycetota bacterium]